MKLPEQFQIPAEWDAARPIFTRRESDTGRAINALSDAFLFEARTVTAAGTITAFDAVVLCDASAAAMTISALSAAELEKKVVVFKKIDSGANKVYIKPASGDTIEGSSLYTLAAQYEGVSLVSSGATTWWKI